MSAGPELSSLVRLTEAISALAQAVALDEVKDLRDKAATWRDYVRRLRLGTDVQNEATEFKLRCDRKLGELLAEMVAARGRWLRDETTGEMRGAAKTLPEGITKVQAHRWRRVASVPEVVFEAWLAETRERGDELTTAGLLALARPEADESDLDDDVDEPGDGEDAGDDEQTDPPPPPPPPPGHHVVRLVYADAQFADVRRGLIAARRRLGTASDSATVLELLRGQGEA